MRSKADNWFECDIRDAATVREVVASANPDGIVHLAAMSEPRHANGHPDDALETNVGGWLNVVEAVRHFRLIYDAIHEMKDADDEVILSTANEINAPFETLKEIAQLQRLPVVNFAAGGIATPADAAMMMQLGVDGVFVGSGIFKSTDPGPRARAIVEATTNFDDPSIIAMVSRGLGEAMPGIEISDIPPNERLQERGW